MRKAGRLRQTALIWSGLCLAVLLPVCHRSDDTGPVEPGPVAPLPQWNGHAAAFSFTSDDGNRVNLSWAEVFRRHHASFTIFVVPRWVRWPGKLTCDDLRAFCAEGFEIAGHGLSHLALTDLDSAALDRELRICRDTLDVILGDTAAVTSLAYPYHLHDRRVMVAASKYFSAARDGGANSAGWPAFSRGMAVWDSVSLYEVPIAVTIASLVEHNTKDEESTRAELRARFAEWKRKGLWVVLMAHHVEDCDAAHLEWIVDEVERDGGFWIASFAEVAAYYRRAATGTRAGRAST